MNVENIKLAIETLKLALKAENNKFVRNNLVDVVSKMFENENIVTSLTSHEIKIGETEGKLNCVKLVKERLNLPLMDAKRMVEEEFKNLGKEFKIFAY